MIRFCLMILAIAPPIAQTQYALAEAEWNRAIEPFKVAGNIYYVGVADVSSYLITTPKGHILLDAGFVESALIVESNIKKLGFQLSDVRLLIISHGHYDHVGGMSRIKQQTNATLLAPADEHDLLMRGGTGDFAFGDKYPYPPLVPDQTLRDGEQILLGGVTLTAHITPGHTRGCTTWTTTVAEAGKTLNVVIPCSISAPGYQLTGNERYPTILADYERTFTKLLALPCDIYLGLHSWDFGLHQKLKAWQAQPAVNPFLDPQGYLSYVERGRAAVRAAAKNQRGEQSR